jgi:hypothetical protein
MPPANHTKARESVWRRFLLNAEGAEDREGHKFFLATKNTKNSKSVEIGGVNECRSVKISG